MLVSRMMFTQIYNMQTNPIATARRLKEVCDRDNIDLEDPENQHAMRLVHLLIDLLSLPKKVQTLLEKEKVPLIVYMSVTEYDIPKESLYRTLVAVSKMDMSEVHLYLRSKYERRIRPFRRVDGFAR